MKTILRICLLAVLLSGASYGQRALLAHLRPAMLPAGHQIAPPMNTLSKSLGDWRGEDETLGATSANASESFRRNYFHAATGQVATLYATYSPAGEKPAGSVEAVAAMSGLIDAAEPREFEIEPGIAASQVRVVRGRTTQWLFRWSYALPMKHEPNLNPLQNIHRRAHLPTPHLTFDVFVPDNLPTDPDAAREFARLVDAAVRPLLGPGAERADVRSSFNQLFSN